MIYIRRTQRPAELTDEVVAQLTAEFAEDPTKRVWDETFIKDSLLDMSNGKCAYCETYITRVSKYMEVEHFKCKNFYPDEVVVWENLLPSCKRCNGRKGKHDVVALPIIDPTCDNPQEHLKMDLYFLRGRDELGKKPLACYI